MPTLEGAVPAVPPGLRGRENAEIGGAVTVQIEPAVANTTAPIYSLANPRTRWWIGEFIALLVIGLLLLWLRPTWLRRTSTEAQARWLPSLGVGLLAIGGGWLSFGQYE